MPTTSPTPAAHTFTNPQAAPGDRLQDLLEKISPEEKLGLLTARQEGIPRLGIPPYNAGQEAAHGIVDRAGSPASVFPQPIGLAATWDAPLLHDAGVVIGEEARGFYDKAKPDEKSFLSLLFPTIDMERDPHWGREEEGYGEDPLLAGRLAAALIRGVQGDHPFYIRAMATPKHFYANNFERDRCFTTSQLTPRLKEEYYLRVYDYAFREGGALSVMTAYNAVDGVPGMVNPELTTLLRDTWGCPGYFITDGGAFKLLITEHHAFPSYAEGFAAALHAGLDMFLDDPELVKNAAREALDRGLVTWDDIDTALKHILGVRLRLGQFDPPGSAANPYAGITRDVICSREHHAVVCRAAREAVTLLKNDGFLPLNPAAARRVLVTGPLANENLPDWYAGTPPSTTTVLDGIRRAFPDSDVSYSDDHDYCSFYSESRRAWGRISPEGELRFDAPEELAARFRVDDWGYGRAGFFSPVLNRCLTTTEDGSLVVTAPSLGGWFVRELFACAFDGTTVTGFLPEERRLGDAELGVASSQSIYKKPYAPGGVERLNDTLRDIRVVVRKDEGIPRTVAAARTVDAVVAVLGNHPLVGARECLDRDTLALPARQAALLAALAEANPNTVLCLVSGYPYALGPQENLVRAVLHTAHGAQELGGALGDALAGKFSPAGRLPVTWYAELGPTPPDINDYDIISTRMTYLYTDRPVLHPFGYGLSYTTFAYEDLSVTPLPGGGAEVSVTVRNTGPRDGDEVVQVYCASTRRDTPRPRKQLCAFTRIHLPQGAGRKVQFTIPPGDLGYYDESRGGLVPDREPYRFMVGASSEDVRLTATVSLSIVAP